MLDPKPKTGDPGDTAVPNHRACIHTKHHNRAERLIELKAMIDAGLSCNQIANATGLQTSTIRWYASVEHWRLPPEQMRKGSVQVYFEPDVNLILSNEAVTRHMRKRDLIDKLISVIARDGLIKAIMDD